MAITHHRLELKQAASLTILTAEILHHIEQQGEGRQVLSVSHAVDPGADPDLRYSALILSTASVEDV
jgi:hypothetical protein